MKPELILVGYPGEVHVGAHLRRAAEELGVRTLLCDCGEAFAGAAVARKINWWLRGRRPTRLHEFSEQVVQACRQARPQWVLATGMAPLTAAALQAIGELGVRRLDFLTDDPWNRAHHAPWFLEALSHYDHVFSPRRSNVDDLQRHGCRAVSYLPFAYAPAIHFPEPNGAPGADVIFAGGADRDRVPYLGALLAAGFNVALYGGYWERYRATAAAARGMADAATLRREISAAKVALCLVRRANRDGHVMRSFEVPAMGACMLAEDTPEHREILGDTVVYFRDQAEMVTQTRWLLDHPAERQRLAAAAQTRITTGANTYRDRLETMLRAGTV